MWTDFFVILLLIILNAFFVAAETAFIAARQSRLKELSRKHIFKKFVENTVSNLNIFITTTQLGGTLVSIAIGWRGQIAVEKIVKPFFGNELITSVIPFLLITVSLMIMGEIVPKKLTMHNPEKMSLLLVIPITIFSKIFMPVIQFINGISDLVLKILGRRTSRKHIPYSEGELKIILYQSIRDGIIPPNFESLIYNAIRIKKITAGQIMIPRVKVVAFDADEKIGEIPLQLKKKNIRFNRYPVYKVNENSFIGFIEAVDLLYALYRYENSVKLADTDIVRKAAQININKTADEILSKMLNNKTYVTVVVGPDGKTQGIVTITEIIKELIKPG